jgi:hypothetical protein
MNPRTITIDGRRYVADDIDGILVALADRAYVVRLWRRPEERRSEWVYLGEFPPAVCHVDEIGRCFGAGWYRAHICGRHGGYIIQVVFGLDELAWSVREFNRRHHR